MEIQHMAIATLCLVLLTLRYALAAGDVHKFEMSMPNVHPNREELYYCTPYKVKGDQRYYIVGFEPNASMDRVHHMILFGCSVPGSTELYWDCGEMASSDSDTPKANPCAEGSHVVYAWARDAKTLELPEDVGFQVGKGTEVAYLVLQVHYARKFSNYYQDSSGINLYYTTTPKRKLAGVLLLATGGEIPPKSDTKMDSYCEIDEDKVIYPFAYRTHTHSLGKVVSGYIARRNSQMGYDWIPLGKRDPLTPQMFYPTFTTEPIYKGDVLAARCLMHSNRTTVTRVGPTNKDEMCNFYVMYYVENDTPLSRKYCITSGPPRVSWLNSEYQFDNIPEYDSTHLDSN